MVANIGLYHTTVALLTFDLQEHDQQLVDQLYTEHGHLGFSRNFFMKVRHT
jgi:hypothetical protein